MSTPTVTQRFSQALQETAARLGLAAPDSDAGGTRVPLELQDAFWQQLCAANDEPLIGIRLGLNLQVGHLDVAGLLLMSCESLGESLEVLLEYLPVIGEGGAAALRVDGANAELRYRAQYQCCRAQRVEMVMACILQLARWSTGGQFQPDAICFAHGPLDTEARYTQLLACPTRFADPQDRLIFPRQMLELPLIQANAALRDQLRELADRTLQQLGSSSLSASVATLIRQQPRAGKEQIAESLAMSGRNLNRKLAAEGLSFKQLRERELQALAEQALGRGDKSLAVAEELGFSDESAFARAFRRWTGMTPASYRDKRSDL